jgi:hypothetical protein
MERVAGLCYELQSSASTVSLSSIRLSSKIQRLRPRASTTIAAVLSSKTTTPEHQPNPGIPGHEDRGMMQLIEVASNKTIVKHR